MKDATIKKYEAAGFKRWTKNGMDRLYIDAEALGLEVERYGTGNIKSATWQGEKVSNADARRILASKAYIDVETGELHVSSDFEKYGVPTVEEMARELAESIEDEEPQASECAPCMIDEADIEKARIFADSLLHKLYEADERGEKADTLRAMYATADALLVMLGIEHEAFDPLHCNR